MLGSPEEVSLCAWASLGLEQLVAVSHPMTPSPTRTREHGSGVQPPPLNTPCRHIPGLHATQMWTLAQRRVSGTRGQGLRPPPTPREAGSHESQFQTHQGSALHCCAASGNSLLLSEPPRLVLSQPHAPALVRAQPQ